MYTFHLLAPPEGNDAIARNEDVLAFPVLGIEVTIPELAARCTLGNIDPQHGEGGSERSSAIEVSLSHPLPSPGARMATIRPDADAIGAMAVFSLRAEGRSPDAALCEAIGRIDALGPRAYDLPVVARHVDAVNAAVWLSLSPQLDFDAKVAWMRRLLAGEVPADEIATLAARSHEELETARRDVRVWRLPGGRVALVTGGSPRALDVGYESGASIVASWTEAFRRAGAPPDEPPVQKWTVARWSSAEPLDIRGLRAALQAMEQQHGGEPGWGGPENLLASPQGRSSRIPPEHVLATILSHVHAPV